MMSVHLSRAYCVGTVPRAIAARRTHRSTACLRARYCSDLELLDLEIDPQRPLHHTRRTGAGGHAKSPVGLIAIGVEGHVAVNVLEIRMIEQVVRLPSELERALLTEAEILEQRKVESQEARKTNQVSLHITNLSQGGGTGEARSIDQHRCSRRINRSRTMVWIADHEWAGLDFPASIVGDRR